MKHPLAYVNRNVECFVELLEAIVATPKADRPYLVYASSSSVTAPGPLPCPHHRCGTKMAS